MISTASPGNARPRFNEVSAADGTVRTDAAGLAGAASVGAAFTG
jgi:hypothetical protein